MRLANYSQVRLLNDNHRVDGVRCGDIGYIVEVYHNGYEVEFSGPDGTTYALITARADELAVEQPAPALVTRDA